MMDRLLIGLGLMTLAVAAGTGLVSWSFTSGSALWAHSVVVPALTVLMVLATLRFAGRVRSFTTGVIGWLFLASSFLSIGSVQLILTGWIDAADQAVWIQLHLWSALVLCVTAPLLAAVFWRRTRSRAAAVEGARS